METLNPVYFYYANGKVAGVTLVGRRQLQEPAASQDPEFVSHWDGLSEEEKSDVMAVEDLRASLQRKAGAGGADNNSEQQPLGDEAEVPPPSLPHRPLSWFILGTSFGSVFLTLTGVGCRHLRRSCARP